MKTVVLTGGGTSGHVTPNIALLPELKRSGFAMHYIGSENGIEKRLSERAGIPYHSISAGKLRRYFDIKNFTDAFSVLRGLRQAYILLGRIKPSVVFSKGGFVSCPVVWASWLRKIPVVIHESDITPGLANKLSIPFAQVVCYTFPESKLHIPKKKGVLTGMPIREELFTGNRHKGLKICGFSGAKPVVLVIGGSLGSERINFMIREILDSLLKDFNVCHICGKGNVRPELENIPGYRQFEYVNEEQPHIYAMADIVVSRAGATVLYELAALEKPNLLIPLTKASSRGDQILNAASFEKQGYSMVAREETLDGPSLLKAIHGLQTSAAQYSAAMKENVSVSGVCNVIEVLKRVTGK